MRLLLLAVVLCCSCATFRGADDGDAREGYASYYADSLAGRKTASGEPYNPNAATCAHRKLPFGTWLEVFSVDTNARARCRVNDRGPFVKGRIIDVSRSVARQLRMLGKGVVRVRITPVRGPVG